MGTGERKRTRLVSSPHPDGLVICASMKIFEFSPAFIHFLLGLVSYLVFSFTYSWLGTSSSQNNTLNVTESRKLVVKSLREGSSLFCTGHNKSTRICKFRYLCYHPIEDEYLFFHGPETIIHGVPSDRFNPALLDMSSVEDHNTQYFNYVDYPAYSIDNFPNVTVIDDFSLIFHRFNPENIMHVFHDDLLPLYHTLRQFSRDMLSVDLGFTLVMMDGRNEGTHFDLYKLFTKKTLILKKELQKANHLTCFRHGVIGISKYTTWYQYGFREPQGQLPHVSLTGQYLRHFTGFVERRLGLDNISLPFHSSDSSYIVLCSREHNRLITNELDLSLAIAQQFNKPVIRVSMATHSFKEQVQIISKASALIGMHGSMLIMAMFLPPGASLIELFPFGINPDHYTPYCTMVELPDMNVIYASWRNNIEENTVTYPHEAPEVGGIDHLSLEEQKDIMNTEEVPQHLCCSDPYWLYRIYQDTIVDIQSLLSVLEFTKNKQKLLTNKKEVDLNGKLYPSKVINLTCQIPFKEAKPALWLSWKPPINLPFLATKDVKYEVWIQEVGTEGYIAYILDITEYLFKDHLKMNTSYNVWVRCIVHEKQGPFEKVLGCMT